MHVVVITLYFRVDLRMKLNMTPRRLAAGVGEILLQKIYIEKLYEEGPFKWVREDAFVDGKDDNIGDWS